MPVTQTFVLPRAGVRSDRGTKTKFAKQFTADIYSSTFHNQSAVFGDENTWADITYSTLLLCIHFMNFQLLQGVEIGSECQIHMNACINKPSHVQSRAVAVGEFTVPCCVGSKPEWDDNVFVAQTTPWTHMAVDTCVVRETSRRKVLARYKRITKHMSRCTSLGFEEDSI